jgi:hypothetical protein
MDFSTRLSEVARHLHVLGERAGELSEWVQRSVYEPVMAAGTDLAAPAAAQPSDGTRPPNSGGGAYGGTNEPYAERTRPTPTQQDVHALTDHGRALRSTPLSPLQGGERPHPDAVRIAEAFREREGCDPFTTPGRNGGNGDSPRGGAPSPTRPQPVSSGTTAVGGGFQGPGPGSSSHSGQGVSQPQPSPHGLWVSSAPVSAGYRPPHDAGSSAASGTNRADQLGAIWTRHYQEAFAAGRKFPTEPACGEVLERIGSCKWERREQHYVVIDFGEERDVYVLPTHPTPGRSLPHLTSFFTIESNSSFGPAPVFHAAAVVPRSNLQFPPAPGGLTLGRMSVASE